VQKPRNDPDQVARYFDWNWLVMMDKMIFLEAKPDLLVARIGRVMV